MGRSINIFRVTLFVFMVSAAADDAAYAAVVSPDSGTGTVHSISNISGQQSLFPCVYVSPSPGFDWAKWSTVGVAFINLVVVSFLAVTTRRDRSQERSSDRANRIDSFWIEKLVMEPHFATIRAFFDETAHDMRAYLEACRGDAGNIRDFSEASIERFSRRYDELTRFVVEPLDIVNPLLSSEVAAHSDEIQDRVTDFFSRHSFPDDSAIQNFRATQKEFWTTLFRGQKRIYQNEN